MTDIQNAISFMSRLWVGKGDEERFMRTLSALESEAERRVRKTVNAN